MTPDTKVHVPSRDVRQRKNIIRQRLWLARLRTMIRNRIHCVVDRHPQLARPAVKDIFSHQGPLLVSSGSEMAVFTRTVSRKIGR